MLAAKSSDKAVYICLEYIQGIETPTHCDKMSLDADLGCSVISSKWPIICQTGR